MTHMFLVAVIAVLTVAPLLCWMLAKIAVSKGLGRLERGHERLERTIREETAQSRNESSAHARDLRQEVGSSLGHVADSSVRAIGEISKAQTSQLQMFTTQVSALAQSTERKLDALRGTVEAQLKLLQDDNAAKLERMRQTVDDKLQTTLDQRLGESFKLVSERLEQVHRGLGEMQVLASGVGDLKKVLANVKTRGGWGEVQLENLLEQVLAPEQYEPNVATKNGSSDRVEFAIKMPGRNGDCEVVWLPIDAKFPLEDYQRLVEAAERGDTEVVECATRQLESAVKSCAREIRDKYLDPPRTTDFAILFLPTEGLYAEVLRRVGLVEFLQRECRIVPAGPTTLWAILNSLQMGFRTLAIQRRSSEVWALLGAVKTEFAKFGSTLDIVHKKLQEASNRIDEARKGSRKIERRLDEVQERPGSDATRLLLDLSQVELDPLQRSAAEDES